jgi:hypothetical protein
MGKAQVMNSLLRLAIELLLRQVALKIKLHSMVKELCPPLAHYILQWLA